MKPSRESPLILGEVTALKLLSARIVAARKLNNQLERAKAYREATIDFELENHRLNGRPLISKLKLIDESLGLDS